MMYTVHRAPGWHGDPGDPVIMTTDDEREAALRAGCRVDLGMPGASNKYDAYAVGEDGEEVDRIESFCCDGCEKLVEWGWGGPIGAMDGKVLECAAAVEKHLVCWLCEDCTDQLAG